MAQAVLEGESLDPLHPRQKEPQEEQPRAERCYLREVSGRRDSALEVVPLRYDEIYSNAGEL